MKIHGLSHEVQPQCSGASFPGTTGRGNRSVRCLINRAQPSARGTAQWCKGATARRTAEILVACSAALAGASCTESHFRPVTLNLPSDFDELERPIQRLFEQRHRALDRVLTDSRSSLAQTGHAYGTVAQLHLAYDYLESAQIGFEAARERDEEEPRWNYYLGIVLAREGRTNEARECFLEVLEAVQGHLPARLRLARLAEQQGATARARELYEGIVRDQPSNVPGRVALAKLALARGEIAQATDHIEEALLRDSLAVAIRYQAGLIYRAAGREEEAQRQLARLPDLNSAHADVRIEDPWWREVEHLYVGARLHDQRALRAFSNGQFDVGILELRQAMVANPKRIFAAYGLAGALHQQGKTQEALAELEPLLDQQPDHVPSLILAARLYAASARRKEARALLSRVRQLAPEDPELERAERDLAL